MSHDYLLQLYSVLDERIELKHSELKHLQQDSDAFFYTSGQIELLKEFKEFLHKGYHHRLPRSILRTLANKI